MHLWCGSSETRLVETCLWCSSLETRCKKMRLWWWIKKQKKENNTLNRSCIRHKYIGSIHIYTLHIHILNLLKLYVSTTISKVTLSAALFQARDLCLNDYWWTSNELQWLHEYSKLFCGIWNCLDNHLHHHQSAGPGNK